MRKDNLSLTPAHVIHRLAMNNQFYGKFSNESFRCNFTRAARRFGWNKMIEKPYRIRFMVI